MPNLYLDFAIDPNFQGVNRLFVLLFENKDDRTVHTKYYLPTVEIDGYNRTGRSRMGKGEGVVVVVVVGCGVFKCPQFLKTLKNVF